jgi:hypothetical protein
LRHIFFVSSENSLTIFVGLCYNVTIHLHFVKNKCHNNILVEKNFFFCLAVEEHQVTTFPFSKLLKLRYNALTLCRKMWINNNLLQGIYFIWKSYIFRVVWPQGIFLTFKLGPRELLLEICWFRLWMFRNYKSVINKG